MMNSIEDTCYDMIPADKDIVLEGYHPEMILPISQH